MMSPRMTIMARSGNLRLLPAVNYLGPGHPRESTSPKFPVVIRVHGRLPGVSGWWGRAADYGTPRRWLTPSRSRAWRWSGVGVVTRLKAGRAGSAGWIWLRQMVARSVSRLVKLCTGRSAGVRLAAALARARGERAAGATGLDRKSVG